VVALDPDRAPAHLALGWALQDEGRFAECRTHYDMAIQLQPDSGTAYLNLGGLQEELGQMADAEESFRTALKMQPQFALPHARLATLLRSKLPAEDLAALEARLTDEKLAEGPRARLLFALAHALDGHGDYARAAECLAQSNAMAAVQNRERHKEYAPADHERFVDGLLRVFDPELLTRLYGAGSPSRRPIFVCGLPRSGTTLIEQVLSSHSQIHGAGELRLARRSFDALPGMMNRPGPPRDCIPHLDADVLKRVAERHLEQLTAIAGDAAPRVVDKMPDNYMYLGLLSLVFPNATFIHCRRDLRDIAVSCWITDFRSIRWANDAEQIASRFNQYHRLMEHWRKVLPAPLHEVDYEESVGDLESVAQRLIAACGLEWEPACLEFYKNERPVRTASVAQVRQPVYKRSVARWKNYEPALSSLFVALPVGPTQQFEKS
jgi:tetratricopeptide (TPR) repeat protein